MKNVLDHGYLKVIETWGSDEMIVESARMSTGKGFLGWGPTHTPECGAPDRVGLACFCGGVKGDEKLLRFLYENKHSTPFEFAGLTLEVQAPLMVFREWHRHRVPFGYSERCLAGDTEITCIGSGGLTRHYTIEHIYNTKHVGIVDRIERGQPLPPGFTRNGYSKAGTPAFRERRLKENPAATRIRKLPCCQNRTLRVLDLDSEIYTTGRMADVSRSGTKELWLVKTVRGHALKTSFNHRFYTREGWKEAGELSATDEVAANGLVAAMERPVPKSLRNGIGVWTSMMRSRLINDRDECYVCRAEFDASDLELDHVVPVVLDLSKALDPENLKPICERCHRKKTRREQAFRTSTSQLGLRWVRLDGRPQRVGEGMTYDISLDGPHHNFVANGLVVHNSARYAPLPDQNYTPTVDRLMVNCGTNKQAGALKGSDELTIESALAWLAELADVYEHAERVYQSGLRRGVPKELARLPIPVGRYSVMRATGNLRGWLGFTTLRSAPNAQREIQEYSNAVVEACRDAFPRTTALFEELRRGP